MVSMKKKSVDKRQDESIKEIIEKVKARGYVTFMVDTRKVDVYEFISTLPDDIFWTHVIKEITLEDAPLSALVIVGFKDATKENISAEQKEKMIEKFKKYIEEKNLGVA